MNRADGRKKSFWPGVIFVSFLAAMITFFVMLQVEKNVLSDYEKVYVWCAGAEIPKGRELKPEDLTTALVQIELDKKSVPDKLVDNPERLVGQKAVITVPKGSVLTETMFENIGFHVSTLYHPVEAGCKSEDLFQIVGGVLRKGDYVHVYTVNTELKQTYLLWENVMVYQVFDASGNVIASENTTTPAARINLLLEKGQAEQFYNELQNGSIRLVKVCKSFEKGSG